MSCCKMSPQCFAKMVFRITFGGSLALVGLVHLTNLGDFSGMVSSGLGPLTPLGTLWAYILPLLQIIGGVCIATKIKPCIGTVAAGVALGSIVLGMLLKSVIGGVPLEDVMGAVNNTLLWLLVYLMVVKCCLCCGSCDKSGGGSCSHGGSSCAEKSYG